MKGAATPIPKVALLPALTSILFTTLAMACASFTTTTPTRLSGVFHPVLGQKTEKAPNPYWFSGNINTRHCHSHAFLSIFHPLPSESGHGTRTSSSAVKDCTEADATPGSLRRCCQPPGKRPGSPAATKLVLFSDPLVSSPSPS
jgi:hypothetical protein